MQLFRILISFILITFSLFAIEIKTKDKILYLIKDKNSTNDQKIINRALKFISNNPSYDTLYLKGNIPFIVDEPILIPSNIKLTADPNVTLKLKDHLNWEKLKPMISQIGVSKWTPWGSGKESISNVEIYGFTIDGGIQDVPDGDTYYALIHFYNPYNIKIHNMKLSNSKWDIIRFSYYKNSNRPNINSEIYNNKIFNSGHEGINIINLKNFRIYNNKILHTRTNCGIRLEYTDNFKIYNNIIGNSLDRVPSGYAGICINNKYAPISKGKIYNNYIYGKNGGIVLDGGDGNYKRGSRRGVVISKNILDRLFTIVVNENKLGDGIKIKGFDNTIIEYNEIKNSDGDGIVYECANRDENYTTVLKFNKIINNSGYAIYTNSQCKHNFILKDNIIYGNAHDFIK